MPAPQFFVNVNRIDPYKNFKFRVKFDGNVVAGVSKVGALTRKTEVVSHREGNDPMNGKRHSPGPTNFEPVTLERGLSFAPEFEAWAMKVYSPDGDSAVSLKNFRQRVTIDLLNLQGIVVRSYTLLRCWVSDYTAMAELDANGNGINFENITVHHEGFVRDDVPEVPET